MFDSIRAWNQDSSSQGGYPANKDRPGVGSVVEIRDLEVVHMEEQLASWVWKNKRRAINAQTLVRPEVKTGTKAGNVQGRGREESILGSLSSQ